MHRLWKPVVEPIVAALRPRVIVEIGALGGRNTRRLAEYARHQEAFVHVIDPEPTVDIDAWRKEWSDVLRWHAAPSLDVLDAIDDPDLVLIDGDHNWYTVVNELRILDRTSGDQYPVTLLHDVGWPYGRRDLYYAPERIPSEYRHEYATAGMWPDRDALDPSGGFNRGLANAVSSGGPRNGVLTAVEDFVAETERSLELVVLALVHGLGILHDRHLGAHSPDAVRVIKEVDSSHSPLLEAVERIRIDEMIEAYQRKQSLREASTTIAGITAERDEAVGRAITVEREAERQTEAAGAAAGREARLRSRRSVKAALAVSRLTRPLFRIVRRLRARFDRSKASDDH